VDSHHLEKLQYFCNRLTDFDKIWRDELMMHLYLLILDSLTQYSFSYFKNSLLENKVAYGYNA